jgi:hypothetical protein
MHSLRELLQEAQESGVAIYFANLGLFSKHAAGQVGSEGNGSCVGHFTVKGRHGARG